MKIKCIDNVFREFIPSDIPKQMFSQKNIPVIKNAYCKKCKKEFTTEPAIIQKETWRKHVCTKTKKTIL